MNEPLRLNLACGTDIRDGWVNLDVVPRWPLARRACDVVWDARKDPIPFASETVELVYAGYLFLHLAPHHHGAVIAEIRRVLRVGGWLCVGEVDMAQVLRRWLESPGDARLAELIWGEQGELPGGAPAAQQELAAFDKHCHGFTEPTLRAMLERHGFIGAKRIRVHSDAVWYELTLACQK